jgi:hypothetical protein
MKFFKPKLLASGRLVFGVKPPRSPVRIVLGRPQLEVFSFEVHLAARTAGSIVEGAFDDKDLPPERPMGFDPQETFT